jgi:hypothetical protein
MRIVFATPLVSLLTLAVTDLEEGHYSSADGWARTHAVVMRGPLP